MAGYSQTPLVKKLGIQPGARIFLIHEPGNYRALLGTLPEGLQWASRPQGPLDFIHCFHQDRKEFERELPKLKRALTPDGMIWVSWPKAASKVRTDVTEQVVRSCGLKNGLVDIKVCAVDETWSGLKFVIPVKERKK
jgi:hypothetical protein